MAFRFSWDTCLCSSRPSPNFINFVGYVSPLRGRRERTLETQICRQFVEFPWVEIILLAQLDIFNDIHYLLLDKIAQVSQEREMERVQSKVPQIFMQNNKIKIKTREDISRMTNI